VSGFYYVIYSKEQFLKKGEDKSMIAGRIASQDVFTNIEKKFTKAGILLRGTRHREGLTQTDMARRIKVTQADLSKMENGKRPIGKNIAKCIEKMFGVNYRYFLRTSCHPERSEGSFCNFLSN